jgi:hypothetical protein
MSISGRAMSAPNSRHQPVMAIAATSTTKPVFDAHEVQGKFASECEPMVRRGNPLSPNKGRAYRAQSSAQE